MKLKAGVALDQKPVVWLAAPMRRGRCTPHLGRRPCEGLRYQQLANRPPSVASHGSTFLGNAAEVPHCALQKKRGVGPRYGVKVSVPFIDHSTEVWNFRSDGTAP